MSPEWASIIGALVGALIAVIASYGVESFRERQRNISRLQSVARTIASEIHSHKEAIEASLGRKCSIEETKKKFTDIQWQHHQNELWGLAPSTGVLFRKYYDALEEIKSIKLTHDSDLEKEFADVLKIANRCLDEAKFPLRNVRIRV